MSNFPVTDEGIRALKVKLLRDLSQQKYPREAIGTVAQKHGLTFDDARALVDGHGWPNPASMGRAADAIERYGSTEGPARAAAVAIAAKPTLKPAPPPAPRPTPPPMPEQVTVVPTTPAAPKPSPVVSGLLATGEKSTKHRTRQLAQKIRGDLKTLQGLIDAERKEAEEAKQREAERLTVDAEIADLERQLAAKRAQRAGLKPPKSSVKPPSSDELRKRAKDVRAWAAANGVECSQRGLIAEDVWMQYQHAMAEGVSA